MRTSLKNFKVLGAQNTTNDEYLAVLKAIHKSLIEGISYLQPIIEKVNEVL